MPSCLFITIFFMRNIVITIQKKNNAKEKQLNQKKYNKTYQKYFFCDLKLLFQNKQDNEKKNENAKEQKYHSTNFTHLFSLFLLLF